MSDCTNTGVITSVAEWSPVFGSLGLHRYAQETSLDAGLPMLVEFISLEYWKIMFREGGFMSHALTSLLGHLHWHWLMMQEKKLSKFGRTFRDMFFFFTCFLVLVVMLKSGSVQFFEDFCEPGTGLWFGSGKCLNLGLDHRFRSSSVSNLFEPVNFPTQFSIQKEGLGYFWKSKHSLITIPLVLKAFPDGLG